MQETIVGIFSLLSGCLLLILYKSFARLTIKQQNKFWGFNFGQKEMKVTEVISVLVGIGFIIFGFLSIFRIIHFK